MTLSRAILVSTCPTTSFAISTPSTSPALKGRTFATRCTSWTHGARACWSTRSALWRPSATLPCWAACTSTPKRSARPAVTSPTATRPFPPIARRPSTRRHALAQRRHRRLGPAQGSGGGPAAPAARSPWPSGSLWCALRADRASLTVCH